MSSSTPDTKSAFNSGGSVAQVVTDTTQAYPAITAVPLALWPSSVSTPPQSVSSAPILNLPPGMGALRRRDDSASTSNETRAVAETRYYADSTVPAQDGGVL